MVIVRDGFVILTQMVFFSACSPLNTSFLLKKKTWKRLPDNAEYAEMRHNIYVWHGDVIFTLQWRHRSTCRRRAAVRFYILGWHGWYGVWGPIMIIRVRVGYKNPSRGLLASRGLPSDMTKGDREGRIFLSYPHTNIMASFSCISLNTAFL